MLKEKTENLCAIITGMGSCLIGFSGGVDSTLLFALAVELLGQKALAVTASSKTFPVRELQEASDFAAGAGGRHIVIASNELDIPEFQNNPRNRCYYCKKELFSKLKRIAEDEGLAYVLDGTNFDDAADHRPGRLAAEELKVRSPLEEAGFTKQDIRDLSKYMGLPTWDKPAFACLSSRFPYGTPITPELVEQVGAAEEALWNLGFRTMRVRYHGAVARIELGEDEFALATVSLRDDVVRLVKNSGFVYVALDLQGYRTGAMNEL
ncbi:MAG: ATP-dependent sacrificial sulfur transferase LarE [Desulfuromonadaceae bacterium]|nr:ATP-dependent sacrificial sulfur transferase LarE [Desulfuromonadaceae bacterium]MDD2856329.1 ATP-dependent sacrificial sulfur transferase LarE [Desulfuromonadaceae bacterium]